MEAIALAVKQTLFDPPNRHNFKIDQQMYKSYSDLNQNSDVEMPTAQ